MIFKENFPKDLYNNFVTLHLLTLNKVKLAYILILPTEIFLISSLDGVSAKCNQTKIDSAGYCMEEIAKVIILGNFRL